MPVVERLDPDERKRRGAWYTPPALVDFLVEQAVLPAWRERAGRLRVLDPACGDGRLLAAAQRAIARVVGRRRVGRFAACVTVRRTMCGRR